MNTVCRDIEGDLLREKSQRDDTSSYVGKLLIRQRRVNHHALAFSSSYLQPGARVIDGCAGPEGSFLSASVHGYDWVGNDISIRFSKNLKDTGAEKVVISDFAYNPYRNGIADGVFLIFALNNISKPAQALQEVARITIDQGTLVIAEPGPTMRVGKIVLYPLLKDDPNQHKLLKGHAFKEDIPQHFANKPYSLEDYTAFFAKNSLGVSIEELGKDLRRVINPQQGATHQTEVKFYEQLLWRYFGFIQRLAKDTGFEIKRAGILVGAINGSKDWYVHPPVEVNTDTWLNELMLARKWRGRVPENLPRWMGHTSQRITCPILVFKKEK